MSSKKSANSEETATERINRVLKAIGERQKIIAQKIGVNETYLSDVKRGASPVSAAIAEALQARYGWNAAWILRGEGPPRIGDAETPYDAANDQVAYVAFRIAYQCDFCGWEVGWLQGRCPKCGRRLDWKHSDVPNPAGEM
jgi:transcriptional regulator with XRE-family HTH domain